MILRVDHFGNLMTNFSPENVPQLTAPGRKIKILVGSKEIHQLAQTYAQGAPGEPFAILGSSGFLEISVNKGSAAHALGVQRGAEVTVELG